MKLQPGALVLHARGVYVVLGKCPCGGRFCYDLGALDSAMDLYHRPGAELRPVPRPDDKQITLAKVALDTRGRRTR